MGCSASAGRRQTAGALAVAAVEERAPVASAKEPQAPPKAQATAETGGGAGAKDDSQAPLLGGTEPDPEQGAWVSEPLTAPAPPQLRRRASLNLGRLSVTSGDDVVGAEGRPSARQSARRSARPQWHCLELWRATPELLALPKAERVARATEELLVTHDGPFPENALTSESPVTLWESLFVQCFLGLAMGGPVAIVLFPLLALALRSWPLLGLWLAATLVLGLHPLPKKRLSDHWTTLCFYRYFSFRMLWTDDLMDGALKEVNAWCGCSVPHGVFPIATWLNGIAANAFMEGTMYGGAASIVLRTPFLRYLTLYGPASDVSASTLKGHIDRGACVTLVADGIAGIFCRPDEVALKSRKGLAKLSLGSGFPVVPSYNFGNTEAYTAVHDPCGIMKRASRLLKVSLFCFFGKFGPIPHRRRMYTTYGPVVVPPKLAGEAPSQEEIDAMHERLLSAIEMAFNNHKAACGRSDLQLKFL